MLALAYSIVLKYLWKCILVQLLLIDMFIPIIELKKITVLYELWTW